MRTLELSEQEASRRNSSLVCATDTRVAISSESQGASHTVTAHTLSGRHSVRGQLERHLAHALRGGGGRASMHTTRT